MNFIKATAEDICHLLKSNGINELIVEKLYGMIIIISNDQYNLLENYIDGESLLSLMSDIDEFEHLVPQSGLRMRIKRIVLKVLLI